MLRSTLELRVYKKYSDLTLLADLTGRLTALSYGTALHGGFRDCRAVAVLDLDQALLWFRRSNIPGRHFAHVEVREFGRLLWEGRLMETTLLWNKDMVALELLSLGYYSSLRDQRVTTLTYTTQTVDAIIKTILTDKCPDINTDQGNIDAAAGSVTLTLAADKYPQDVIVEDLAPLGDTDDKTYYFAVWESRKAWYKARAATNITWEVPLASIASGRLSQAAQHMRNKADAYDGTTRTAAASNADSQVSYPVRDGLAKVPSGTTAARAQDARDRFIADRKDPQQESRFTINGPIWRRQVYGLPLGQRSAVRAGDTMALVGLLPIADVDSPALDNLRIFYILQADYDALSDSVVVVPDRPPSQLDLILARQGVETTR